MGLTDQLKNTLEQYTKTRFKPEDNINFEISDLNDENGTVKGVRIILPLTPTLQMIYSEDEPDLMGVFVYPGDDAAIASQLILEISNALYSMAKKIRPNFRLEVVAPIAPILNDEGISFTANIEEVYEIVKQNLKNTAKNI